MFRIHCFVENQELAMLASPKKNWREMAKFVANEESDEFGALVGAATIAQGVAPRLRVRNQLLDNHCVSVSLCLVTFRNCNCFSFLVFVVWHELVTHTLPPPSPCKFQGALAAVRRYSARSAAQLGA